MKNPSQTLPLTGQGLKKIGLDEKIKKILETLKKRHWCIGIMESCTGGAMANCITNIPGASDVFEIGKVTYSIKAKIDAGVEEENIKKYGVFSVETAEEMARRIEGEVGLGITGNMNDPAEVFVAVRIGEKVESRKLKVESKNKNEIKARKEKKMKVVERVVEMINDNI
jgi:PncC family amidohydrolase